MYISEHNAQIQRWNASDFVKSNPNFSKCHIRLLRIVTINYKVEFLDVRRLIFMWSSSNKHQLDLIVLTFGQLVWIGICHDKIWHRDKMCFEQCSNLFDLYLIPNYTFSQYIIHKFGEHSDQIWPPRGYMSDLELCLNLLQKLDRV